MNHMFREHPEYIFVSSLFGFVLYRASIEFYNITWGTGAWWGEFSLKWGLTFILFLLFCLVCLFGLVLSLWKASAITSYFNRLVELRNHIGFARWPLAMILLVLPIWLLQYSPMGVVFSGLYIRLLIWSLTVICLAFFITNEKSKICVWSTFLVAVLLSAAAFSFAFAFINVTSYPFSLGWSEGNRMWDYSLLFGSNHYNYLHERPPMAYLDLGRQLGGGLPFIFPHLTIFQERLWLALMMIVPYVLLGWTAFFL